MLFFQEGTADTSAYLILGYAVALGAMLLHLASLSLRRRNLQRDLNLLDEISKDEA